jgi:hypothetical protein
MDERKIKQCKTKNQTLIKKITTSRHQPKKKKKKQNKSNRHDNMSIHLIMHGI